MLYSYVNTELDAVARLRGHLINLNDLYFKHGPYNLHSVYVTCAIQNTENRLIPYTPRGVCVANNDFNNFTNVLSLFAGDFVSIWAFCEFYDMVCKYKTNYSVTTENLYKGLLTYCNYRGITITWM